MENSKSVAELARLVEGELIRGDPSRRVGRVMPLDSAEVDAVTFITRPKYLPLLEQSKAGAVLVGSSLLREKAPPISPEVAVIEVKSAYAAYARAAQLFAPEVPQPRSIHPTAVIDGSAVLGRDVAVGPLAYVGPGAVIGDRVVLHAGVHVEARAQIGAGSLLYNHAVVRHGCTVGARCVLHPGVVIGADGFGFAQEIDEDEVLHHLKIPQLGTVILEDDVEVGANSCIDRAALGATRIGAGTKIDNLVQVGHNVQIGPASILIAQSGVAGSARLGRGVFLGAQSGVAGHLSVGDGVLVYGQAGVISDVPAREKVAGSPALPVVEFFRTVVRVNKLEDLLSRLKKVEKWIANGRG